MVTCMASYLLIYIKRFQSSFSCIDNIPGLYFLNFCMWLIKYILAIVTCTLLNHVSLNLEVHLVSLLCFCAVSSATSIRANISEVLVHGTLMLRIWKHRPHWYAPLLFLCQTVSCLVSSSHRSRDVNWLGLGRTWWIWIWIGFLLVGSGSGNRWKNKDPGSNPDPDPKQDVELICILVWEGLKIVLLII